MDTRIWSGLPEHLLDRILSFLPLTTLLRLRSTCKRFNTLLHCPCFISKYSLSSSPSLSSSFVFLSHPQFQQKCPLFNTETNSWCNTPLSLPSSTTLLSSSNGLLCFSDTKSSTFIIHNLLTKSSRLVKFPTYPFEFELLTFVSSTNGYKLFVISTVGSSSNDALIYNSTVDTWQQFEGLDRNLSYHQNGAFRDGHLFFTTPEPFTVLSFDLEGGNWERPVIGLPGDLIFARLTSDEERNILYLIGGVGVSGICRSMKVWELSEDGENWLEVESMPEMVFRKFVSVCYHNYEHVYCFWHQGLICVCCFIWPEILYYKVSRRTWYWLPKCPSLPDKWSCGFRWFSFKPRLYATTTV